MKYLGKIQDNKDLVTKEYVDRQTGIYPVIGTQTAATGSWTGSIDVPALYDGLTIAYWLPYAGSGYATLNLTLSGGGTTGAINCYYGGTTRLTTHYGAGNTIIMTYRVNANINGGTYTGWWAQANYDSDSTGYYTRKIYPNMKAGANGVFPYTLIMQLPDGTWESLVTSSSTDTSKTRNTHGFLLGHVLLMYANATYTSANIATYNVWSAHSGLIDHRYSFNTANNATYGTTGYKPIYLVGTVTNGLFYLDSTWWTQTLPTSADGKVYIYIGDAYDYYRLTLSEEKPMYVYTNGAIREYSQDAGTVNGLTVQTAVPSGAVFTDTDTKVTAVGNHYTPTGTTTKSASGASGTSGTTVQVVTGVTMDAKGHVTAVTSGAATDTTYNFSGTTFYSGASGTAEHNSNNAVKNGHYYYTSNGPATSLGASTNDGGLYVQSYSDSWVGQIAQDYRNGRLFVRGKNNGTWQSWLKVYDSGNLTSQSAASGGTAVSLVTTGEKYTWNNKSSLALGETSSTAYRGDRGKTAYDHSQATHARTDATAVASSTTNGNIKINGTETTVYTHPGSGTNPHGTTKSDVGLGNVGNFKAVSTVASQGLTSTEQSNARANIGAGTSSLTIGTSSTTAAAGDHTHSNYANKNHVHDGIMLRIDGDTSFVPIEEIVAGTNITLTEDQQNSRLTISATGSGEVNQNAFSNVVVGSTTIAADSKTDTLTLVAGSNITLTPDATNDKVTIAATDGTYSTATVTPTVTATTGTKVDATMRKFGNVVQFTLVFKNTSAVSAGSNVFAGTLSTNVPPQTINACGYYGSCALPMSINASGSIVVRNGSGSTAVTCSSNTTIGATWLV